MASERLLHFKLLHLAGGRRNYGHKNLFIYKIGTFVEAKYVLS